MPTDAELPSLDALAAHSERVDQGLLAARRDRATAVLTAQDPDELVQISVDSAGSVVDVAVNAALVGGADAKKLANAVLSAARSAQRKAGEAGAERRAYYLGHDEGELRRNR